MIYSGKKYILWGLGLSGQQSEQIRALIGDRYTLRNWGKEEFTASALAVEDPPCLISCSLEGCEHLRALPPEAAGHLDMVPTMLLLDKGFLPQQLEKALDLGATDIIRPPLTKKRLASVLRRAGETAALQQDIHNMTKEIFLERELLERKNQALSFLVTFLTGTAEQQNEADILRTAYTSLKTLFPVLSLHAVLWSQTDGQQKQAKLFLAAPSDHPAHALWKEQLLDATRAQFPDDSVQTTTRCISLNGGRQFFTPSDGHTLNLPLMVGKHQLGLVMALTSMERNLTRDQAMALDSASHHLALTLNNVLRLEQMRQHADYDSLTGIHNRRHFESTLAREMDRHQRYGQELSLLLLDLDHFKRINDSWGHLAGDSVLRAVTDILRSTVRKADYCARYGGEEFVVILPQTGADNAALLAERLRRKVQALKLPLGDKTIGVTVSIGVSCLSGCRTKDENALTREADAALYQAKDLGRNRVVRHSLSSQVATAAV